MGAKQKKGKENKKLKQQDRFTVLYAIRLNIAGHLDNFGQLGYHGLRL
jgi:hypothetical protein